MNTGVGRQIVGRGATPGPAQQGAAGAVEIVDFFEQRRGCTRRSGIERPAALDISQVGFEEIRNDRILQGIDRRQHVAQIEIVGNRLAGFVGGSCDIALFDPRPGVTVIDNDRVFGGLGKRGGLKFIKKTGSIDNRVARNHWDICTVDREDGGGVAGLASGGPSSEGIGDGADVIAHRRDILTGGQTQRGDRNGGQIAVGGGAVAGPA